MTLPIPLTVRLTNARVGSMHIERELRSLSFRSVAPGGFASAQFSLDRPLSMSPDELAYYSDVDVEDRRNGNCVWCGRLEDPGRGVGADGQVWDLAAVGPSAHAQDRTVPLIYVDRDLSHWYRSTIGGNNIKNHQIGTTEYDPDDTIDAVEMQITSSGTSGAGVPTNAAIRYRYGVLREAGQLLARFDYRHIEGRAHANLRVQAVTSSPVQTPRNDAFSTSETTPSPKVMTTDFDATADALEILLRWTGTQTQILDDITWTQVGGLYVQAQRFTKAGAVVGASGYTAHTVLAHQIVEDLLGRLLTQYDGANATVATTSYAIDHLAYLDGVTAAGVLDDLMLFEPAYFWQATTRNSAGKYKFEWKAWPTTVRYEADVVDGYTSTGSADGLFNRVSVRRTDWRGWPRITVRTATVPVLDDAGLIRQDTINLGGDATSISNTIRAGDQFLSEHATPPNAGTLTVARPIYDHDRGTMVQPWEIEPGHLIRVRGIQPNTNSLNATNRDGVTVFRIIGKDYDTGSAAAQLELDSYPPTIERALAQLAKRPKRRS